MKERRPDAVEVRLSIPDLDDPPPPAAPSDDDDAPF
jgi:hypothetical protein